MFYVVATLSLRWIAVAASAGPGTVGIWLIGLATIFIPLALCVLELSSRYPQEGGMYVWSKRAFGAFAGFLTGWIYWTSKLPYFPAVLYFAASNALYVGGSKWKGLQGSAAFFMTFSLLGLRHISTAQTNSQARLGFRVVLWAAAFAPVSRAGAIRVANFREFPHPPEARRSLRPKHVLIADEPAEMNKLLPRINRFDVRLFQIHLGKYAFDGPLKHSVVGTDYLWNAHCRPPLRIIRRFQ
jgi:hypothetical protein